LPGHRDHLHILVRGLDEHEQIALTHLLAKARTTMLEGSGTPRTAQPAFPA
jgi:hypothetical protein